MEGKDKRSPAKSKDIVLKTIDDLVRVNTLFTAAVFMGLSFAVPKQHSLEINRPECDADMKTIKRLVVYEVVSFSAFLLSTLAGKSLKVYLSIFYPGSEYSSNNDDKPRLDGKKARLFNGGRGFIFAISMLGSILGVLFLAFSIFCVVEIKLGKLSCGITETRSAIATLIIFVGISFVIYIPFMLIALIYCMIEP